MSNIFTEFGIILGVATAMALVMRLLRQPLIIGHIITGILVGPLFLGFLQSDEIFKLFSEMGIAFLLFTVGLNLNPKILKEYGKTALITGISQVVITSGIGFIICRILGFDILSSFYIAIAVSFSSTIIILKLISDKGDLEKLYAKISIGFLLVQDLIVFALLFSLPLLSTPDLSPTNLLFVLGKAALLITVVIGFAKIVIGNIHHYLSKNSELLFLFATAWGLGIAVLFRELGFPLETGALVGGIALALLPARHEMAARLSPLRDFFIVIFFVLLGSQIAIANIGALLIPGIILTVFVLIGNPIILMAVMGLLGYRKKTSLETGLTVAQLSEFSLIFVALGVSLGHVGQNILSLVTLVGVATIFGSTYLILYSNFWYRILSPYLGIFERRKVLEKREIPRDNEIILFGANRIGYDFLENFKDRGSRLLVVDHDPEVIKRVKETGVSTLFGDAGDPDFLDSIDMSKAEMIISTIPDLDTNMIILRQAQDKLRRTKNNGKAPVMVSSHSISNALKLYQAGATYVILPHFLGASYASTLAKKSVDALADLDSIREAHIAHLRKRIILGHEHPMVERYR